MSAPFIPAADIKDHIKTHKEAMPQISGPKAYALSVPIVIDTPDVPDNCAFQYSGPTQPGSNQKGSANASPSTTSSSVLMNMTHPDIFPEFEISASDDLTDHELQPHFFTPDFLRPLPEPGYVEQLDDEDFDDAYWLIPGMVPEPYWDINMGQEFNYA